MTDFERLLNPEQFDAATSGDGPLLVLAAAGTGKTRTLVFRVAYLLEKGVSPWNLLLLTFTNRAAREMLDRAEQVAGPMARNVWGGTFHHVCHRLLRRPASYLGYPDNFSILDREDSRCLVGTCMKQLNLQGKDFPKRDVIASIIGLAVNRQLPVEEVVAGRLDSLSVDPADIVRVCRAYEEAKLKGGYMDFDDLLVNGLRLLEEVPDVRERYQGQFQHVLVDEYQDTNLLQARFVDLIGARHRNVMVVGDDFQCIYSWRGANFRNIMDFPKRYPDARIVKLERNYRSTPEVLEVANACIAGNPDQFQKTLRPTRPASGKPRICYLRDGEEQADLVVDVVRDALSEGYSLGDIAVLYRAHFHSIELQMALSRAGVPYQVVSGTGVFEQAHSKDVLAFLRVAEGPADRLSFERLLGLLHGLGPRGISVAWEKTGGAFDSRDPASRERLLAALKPSVRSQWAALDALLGEYHALGWSHNGAEAIGRFTNVFYGAYLERTFDNPQIRLEDVHELGMQIDRAPSVRDFLDEVALWSNVEAEYARHGEERRPALRLSTIHQAKGLEWPIVILLWACEGMFPSGKATEESDDDSEERRLFYVTVTRAKDHLLVLAPEWRELRNGGTFYCKPSRFVTEIPSSLVQPVYGRRRIR
jgi:DNA helicase-2/ATP-dependent DNA helicase PcrA